MRLEKYFEIPFNSSLSKNKAKISFRGRLIASPTYRALMTQNIEDAEPKLEADWELKKKIWLRIMVEKPNNRSDAINYLDAIADIAQKASDTDDRYYSIEELDWKIEKDNPMIKVWMKQ